MKYKLTDEDYSRLVKASQPVTYMVFGGVPPESPYEKAMRLWNEIAQKYQVQVSTIRPSSDGDDHAFEAEPLQI